MLELLGSLDVRTNAGAVRLTRRLFHSAPLVALLFAARAAEDARLAAVRALRSHARERDHIPEELLAVLRAPTLLLWGASEKLLPASSSTGSGLTCRPEPGIEVVPGFGHVPQMERPRELVQRLRAFANQNGLLSVRASGPSSAADPPVAPRPAPGR